MTGVREETPTARTIALDVPGWPGHDAGQHVDVRLTSADGYTAVRTYSIANPPETNRVELTVEPIASGEVSPYLTQVASAGDQVELRGPIGGWFVWKPEQTEPVQLVAGGSGLVPLMAMIRSHAQAASRAPFRLLCSARSPETVLYARELSERAAKMEALAVTYAYTRSIPPGWSRPPRRVDAALIAASAWSAERKPTCYVCGPTGFVESVAVLLTSAGHETSRIRTERFGPTEGR